MNQLYDKSFPVRLNNFLSGNVTDHERDYLKSIAESLIKKQEMVNLVNRINKLVVKKYNSTMFRLKSECRKRELVEMRFIAYYLISEHGYVPADIAPFFNKDRTTIIHGIQTIQDRLSIKDNSIALPKKIETIIRELKNELI